MEKSSFAAHLECRPQNSWVWVKSVAGTWRFLLWRWIEIVAEEDKAALC